MDWTNEMVMKFLELYQMHPCIWDPNNCSHKNIKKLNNAWIDIRNNMGEPCTVKELKRKKESLMSAYRGYRTRIKKSETIGANDLYQPKWFAYEFMDSFLGAIYKCNPSIHSKPKHTKHTSEDNTDNKNTFVEMDTTDYEEVCPSFQNRFINQDSSSQRKQHDPLELQHLRKQMGHEFNILKSQPYEEDECNIFGKLVATKMRKLAEDRRDLMMVNINQLFYDESQRNHRPHSSGSSSKES
ncbi:hypothetical protein K1T71_000947 [Dendrolimus kikuchii]|uniref:Uncharacterized protein n=1 Tax=Dendrolimus kikuchii TaxID=765133 RepID=A0ACC1DHV1_9NEOP|nr:hypothetical protein K1T71_000947 [Dendrolimus kikuchii]